MRFIVAATAVAITFVQALVGTATADTGIRQEKVQFASGASSAVINGQIKGDTLAWTNGQAAWTPAAQIPALASFFGGGGPPPLPGGMPPPLPG